ncbi:hypothetical protein TWF481_006023 [Arthrobotrys musiformis]|uniref:Uncharacterized protein n=1 Tax=Arthrobotrys musiformis TaxID=47236 RepID=A0AAV9WFH8_9PEZI
MCLYRSNHYTCGCYVLLNLRSPAHRCQGPRDSKGICGIQKPHPLEIADLPRLCGRCEKIRVQTAKITKLEHQAIPAAEAAGQNANVVRLMSELAVAKAKLDDAVASTSYN